MGPRRQAGPIKQGDRSRLRDQKWLPFHPPRKIPRVRRYANEHTPKRSPSEGSRKNGERESEPFRTVRISSRRVNGR